MFQKFDVSELQFHRRLNQKAYSEMAAAFTHYFSYNSVVPRNSVEKRVAGLGPENLDIDTNPRFCKSNPTSFRKKFSNNCLAESQNFLLKRTICDFMDSGRIEIALHLFERLSQLDIYICNVLIRGLTDQGMFNEAINIYYRMNFQGIGTDKYTYPFLIKSIGGLLSFEEGQKVHAKLFKVGLELDVYICNSLLFMYAKLGFIELAERVFQEMPLKDLVSWNSMTSGYVSAMDGLNSLKCFSKMQRVGFKCDRFSLINALSACSLECYERSGKEIHCQAFRTGFEEDVMVQTTLVDMYAKCCRINYAERVFERISRRSVATWNAMIGGYGSNNCISSPLACLKSMQETDRLKPDGITMINILPSFAQVGTLLEGKAIHGYSIRQGFLPNLVLETALLTMYGECGKLNSAVDLFDQMAEKNLASRNSLVAAYVRHGQSREALDFFKNLVTKPLEIDAVTIASILPAYAELGSLRKGLEIHGYIVKLKHYSNTFVSNSMIYMYAKCGDLFSALRIFDNMSFKDVISWNAIVMAYGIHGLGAKSIKLFEEMKKMGVKPNESTFVSLLSSCAISGLDDMGWKFFNSMKNDYKINPGIEHYSCMLDLIGRSGDFDRAKAFIEEMPIAPTARIWGSLLTASRNHKNIQLAEFLAEKILSFGHDNTGCYILLANMYAEARRWEDVKRIKTLMNKQGLQKTVGFSLVEVKSKSHRFFNRDRSHGDSNMIYDVLDVLLRKTEDKFGHNLAKFRIVELDKHKSNSPETHSVRLAICYGLISSEIAKPVIVKKNTRICEDCHIACKKISTVTKREIIVGDLKVFHHFKNGSCSCGDYWR